MINCKRNKRICFVNSSENKNEFTIHCPFIQNIQFSILKDLVEGKQINTNYA